MLGSHMRKKKCNQTYKITGFYSRLSFWLLRQILFTAEVAGEETNLTFVLAFL